MAYSAPHSRGDSFTVILNIKGDFGTLFCAPFAPYVVSHGLGESGIKSSGTAVSVMQYPIHLLVALCVCACVCECACACVCVHVCVCACECVCERM